MLSVLSKMAARNCIFVKCFFEKTQKSAPLQLNFECSGVFWLNLVTLGSVRVRDIKIFIRKIVAARVADLSIHHRNLSVIAVVHENV